MTPEHFATLKADFLAALKDKEELYVADLFGGSQPEYRVNVRVINAAGLAQPVRPHAAGAPDARKSWRVSIPNTRSSTCRASRPIPERHGCRSDTVIAVNLTEKLILIGGTEYAGEMKKGVFGILNYLLPATGRDADALLGQYRPRRQDARSSSACPAPARPRFPPTPAAR